MIKCPTGFGGISDLQCVQLPGSFIFVVLKVTY